MTTTNVTPLIEKIYGGIVIAVFTAVLVACGYGMSTTANNDPQAVCLTRPWLDVKPPC